jgi:hypothetical protein
MIPKLLLACRYDDRAQVQQMRRELRSWPLLRPELALEILDASFADPLVRQYAVVCVDQFSDSQLSDILLQLVQALKYESAHNSALARMLLRRALRSGRSRTSSSGSSSRRCTWCTLRCASAC